MKMTWWHRLLVTEIKNSNGNAGGGDHKGGSKSLTETKLFSWTEIVKTTCHVNQQMATNVNTLKVKRLPRFQSLPEGANRSLPQNNPSLMRVAKTVYNPRSKLYLYI